MLERPVHRTWILLSIGACMLTILAIRIEAMDIRMFIWSVAGLFYVIAALDLANWIAYQYSARLRNIREAMAITEHVRILQAVANLNDYQARLLESGSPVVKVLAGYPDPIFVLQVGGGEIPFEFIREFLRLSDDVYLCPVRTWAEGTKQREWAQLLTNHLVIMGFAVEARGNQPAHWIDRTGAVRWMGLNIIKELSK